VHWLRGLLRRFADEGRTVFVSSHQLAELAQAADDVVIINQGRLIAAGPMTGLLERSQASSLEDLFLGATSPDAPSTHPALTRPRSLS
jgi:ABC-2 type transport system ATP-binding protein